MSARILVTTISAIVLLSGTAFAQTSSGAPGTSTTGSALNAAQSGEVPQTIKDKLQQQGFSDVKVVPRSFIISAKDKNGDEVNMIIGPHSMLILSESAGRPSGTMGSGSDSGTSK